MRNSKTTLALGALCVMGVAATAAADNLHVPRQYRTLAEAASAAQSGDTIVLSGTDGTKHDSRNIVFKPGVTIRGGRIRGLVSLYGTDLTMRRVKHDGPSMKIVGDGLMIDRCRFHAARLTVESDGATIRNSRSTSHIRVELVGDDVSLVDNRLKMQIDTLGDNLLVEGNRMRNAYSDITGDGARVIGNRINAGFGSSSRPGIGVTGAGAQICDNRVVGANGTGVRVSGSDAVVENNRVTGVMLGVWVTSESTGAGEGTTVTENSIRVGTFGGADIGGPSGCPAILVIADREEVHVERNTVRHIAGTGIDVVADAASIVDNQVNGVSSSTSIRVISDGASVEGNDVIRRGGRGVSTLLDGHGIDVIGDEVVVFDNAIQNAGFHGIVVEGAGNTIANNDMRGSDQHGIAVVGDGSRVVGNRIDRAGMDGVIVYGENTVVRDTEITRAGRFGICVEAGSNGSLIESCEISKCDGGGLLNAAAGVRVVNTTVVRNDGADVYEVTPFEVFHGNDAPIMVEGVTGNTTNGDGWFEDRLEFSLRPTGHRVRFAVSGIDHGEYELRADRVLLDRDGWVPLRRLSGDEYDLVWSTIRDGGLDDLGHRDRIALHTNLHGEQDVEIRLTSGEAVRYRVNTSGAAVRALHELLADLVR